MSKKYSNVIEGLNMLLDLKTKEDMNLDFSLLSNLTYSVLNMKITEKEEMEEKVEEETADEVFVDEEEFDVLSNELTVLEEQLEEEDEEEEEGKGTKNDQQFLISQLSKLFERIQKMVYECLVIES